MMWMQCRVGALVGLAGACVVALPAGAQQAPATTGVVVVRAAGSGAADAGLGFVIDGTRVVASIDAGVNDFVVSSADGDEEWDASREAYHEATGLGLLVVQGLSAPAYRFARDPAVQGQEVHGATRDDDTGIVKFVPGRVREVRPGAAVATPGAIMHDPFSPGAPLLNVCGQIVGAVRRNPASIDGRAAVPAGWLRSFAGAADPGEPCPPEPDPVPAPPDPVPAPPTPGEVEEALALTPERRRMIQLGLTTLDLDPGVADGVFGDVTREAISEWQRRNGEEPTGYLDARAAGDLELIGRDRAARVEETEEERLKREEAERLARLAEEEAKRAEEAARAAEEAAKQNQKRYTRWIAGALGGGAAVALLLWVVSRRAVDRAKKGRVQAEVLARSAQSDLATRDARDRLASGVPAVFLDGADADGHPIALRIPGSVIADDGAVVGRDPFKSTVVLDHGEVSREHFRLVAEGASVLIEENGSTNGTRLNNVPLAPGVRVPLQSGAVLEVGSLTFTVTLQT